MTSIKQQQSWHQSKPWLENVKDPCHTIPGNDMARQFYKYECLESPLPDSCKNHGRLRKLFVPYFHQHDQQTSWQFNSRIICIQILFINCFPPYLCGVFMSNYDICDWKVLLFRWHWQPWISSVWYKFLTIPQPLENLCKEADDIFFFFWDFLSTYYHDYRFRIVSFKTKWTDLFITVRS